MLKTLYSFIFCTAIAGIASAQSELPDIGSSTTRVLSLQKEQLIGDDYMRQLRQFAPLMDDPEIVSYVNELGYRLVSNSPDTNDRSFYFFVIEDDSLNAFALPGGYIGLHSKLFLMAESESELAGVLAHEISHVTQRHLARRIEKADQITFPTLAAILGGILIAAANPQAGIAIAAGAQAGAQQVLINHTRENEAEADRIGMQVMSMVDLDPNGMTSFFEKMEKNTRYMRTPPQVLLTHPVSQQRISDARLRAAELKPKPVQESIYFRLMQVKIQDTIQKDIRAREKEVALMKKERPDDLVTHYAEALLAIRQHQFVEAQTTLEKLLSGDRRNASYLVALSNALIGQEKNEEAETLLYEALSTQPGHHALTMAYAQALMMNGKAELARQKLMAYIGLPDREPNVFQLLASAQESSGHADEVHESHGLYLQAIGDLRGALQQFEMARRSRSSDPYSTTRINARIKHIQQILLERRNTRR